MFPHTQGGAVHCFGYLLAGTIEIFPRGETLARVESVLADFVDAVAKHVLDSLDTELADCLVSSLD